MLYTFDNFVLDTNRFRLSKNGSAVHAEPQVIELLTFFIRNRDRLITRDELIQSVWNGRVVSDSAISGRIKVARKLLGDNGRRQKYIRTIHKKGFAFVAPIQTPEKADNQPGTDPLTGTRFPVAMSAHRGNGTKPSVGVLKFSSVRENNESRFFADGLTEDLITTLSKIKKLLIVSHPGILSSEYNSVNARQMGVDIDVNYVLYGSVRTDGKRLRISVHLIDCDSGQYLWTQRYDCPEWELFNLQDDITKEVVSSLQVELTEGDQALLLSRGTENIEAWQLTFQGQAAVLEHHQTSVRRGLEQLEQAVRLDRNYALAWSALGVAHWKEFLNSGWSESREKSLRLAVEAGERATALAPQNANVLAMRSLVLVSQREFAEAKALAMQALHCANSEANAIALAGITLRACCEPDLSVLHTQKAMQLCPIYPAWYPYGIAVCYWISDELERAVEFAQEAVRIDPSASYVHLALAMINAELGSEREARAAVVSLQKIDPKFSSRAFTEGMPFSDPAVQMRRAAALKKAGVPE